MRGRSALLVFAAVGVLAVAARIVPHDLASRVMLDVAAAIATGATWAAAYRHRGSGGRAWAFVAAGLTTWLLGDIAWDVYTITRGETPDLSVADLLYLSGYPLMAAGVVGMLRLRAPGRLREGVLDGLALSVAAALATWQFLVEPSIQGPMPMLYRLVYGAYPLVDVLLFAAVAWLVLSPGRRGGPTVLLIAFLATMFVLDVGYAFLGDSETFNLEWLDAGYPVSYALLAAAALHPRVDELTEPSPAATVRLHPARVLFLGAALLTAPVLAIARSGGSSSRVVFFVASSLTLGVIVLARFTLAVREREAAQSALAHQATHDLLTGLVNRMLLMDRLEHAIDRDRRRGSNLAVLYLDLDRFKAVNDTWGHRAGDVLLVETAERLRGAVRPGDTVARLGGDEFVILCEDIADPEDAIAIAERTVHALRQPVDIERGIAFVSACVGIALRLHDDDSAESLLRDADVAMYRAKQSGRDRWEMFDTEMRELVVNRRETESALERAVNEDEMRLLYQPIVRLGTADVVGFEALVRWKRPGRGLVEPDDFIGLAEETGLVVPIGEWVLEQSCRQISLWNDAHPDRPPLGMSVNVSPRQFSQSPFAATVAAVLERTGADPTCLTLEITESVLVEEAETALAQLEAVKRLGVRLAIDDFGTGYSALSYLRRFPIDIIKIDQVFMQELGRVAPDTTLVAAMVAMAHALGHEVVAEGTETAEQVEAVYRLGCDLAQGFYFARPLTTGDADRLVRGARRLAAEQPVAGRA